jgi:hypothetical protein
MVENQCEYIQAIPGSKQFTSALVINLSTAFHLLLESDQENFLKALNLGKNVSTDTHFPLLLFRFYDGAATGLLPPRDHSYDTSSFKPKKTNSPPIQHRNNKNHHFGRSSNTMTLLNSHSKGSVMHGQSLSPSQADRHEAGHKNNSCYVSTSAYLTGLLNSPCQIVKTLIFGSDGLATNAILKETQAAQKRQAPYLAVFLVTPQHYEINWSRPDSIEEREVLFNADKGKLANFMLFKMENPFHSNSSYNLKRKLPSNIGQARISRLARPKKTQVKTKET